MNEKEAQRRIGTIVEALGEDAYGMAYDDIQFLLDRLTLTEARLDECRRARRKGY